jgi:hypothetical protein
MHPDPATRATPRRARRRWVAGGLALALVVGLSGAPTGAQAVGDEGPKTPEQLKAMEQALLETLDAGPDAQPPSPDDPFAEVVAAGKVAEQAARARLTITERSEAANRAAFEAAVVQQEAERRETAAQRRRDAAADELATERDRLSDLTVRAYVTGGDQSIEQYEALLEGDTTDPAAGRTIMFGQVLQRQREVTDEAEADLVAAKARLRETREVLGAAEAAADEAMATATELATQRAGIEQAHLDALAAVAAAETRLRAAGSAGPQPVPLEIAIIGLPRLEAEDLASWFLAGPWRPKTTTPIEDYARWFIEEGRTEGIRGDIAFAQAVLETGGFANTDSVVANNFSGIGHYDNAPLGFIFPSPRAGVRAQIQLLKGYAVKNPSYANPLVDRRLRGPAGCCQTWGDLTTVWATDPTYGPKVMLLYSQLVDHALDRRAAGA